MARLRTRWRSRSPDAVEALRAARLHGNVFDSDRLGDPIVFHFRPRGRVTITPRVSMPVDDRNWTLGDQADAPLAPAAVEARASPEWLGGSIPSS